MKKKHMTKLKNSNKNGTTNSANQKSSVADKTFECDEIKLLKKEHDSLKISHSNNS